MLHIECLLRLQESGTKIGEIVMQTKEITDYLLSKPQIRFNRGVPQNKKVGKGGMTIIILLNFRKLIAPQISQIKQIKCPMIMKYQAKSDSQRQGNPCNLCNLW